MNIDTFPKVIHDHIKGMIFEKDTIGCSKANIYHLKDNNRDLYLKAEASNVESEHEQKVLRWLKDKLPVPEIIAQCSKQGTDYLLMTKAIGEMACSERYLKEPETLVRLLAEGLKMLQAVDISECPFNRTLNYKLQLAEENIKNGDVDMSDWEEDNEFSSPEELYTYLVENQPEEDLVFTHGDYCLPNIFFENNKVTGFIDLGRAGIADKWQDIALCVRSLEYNANSKEYTRLLFDHLGIEPNYEKIRYYIMLDELF